MSCVLLMLELRQKENKYLYDINWQWWWMFGIDLFRRSTNEHSHCCWDFYYILFLLSQRINQFSYLNWYSRSFASHHPVIRRRRRVELRDHRDGSHNTHNWKMGKKYANIAALKAIHRKWRRTHEKLIWTIYFEFKSNSTGFSILLFLSFVVVDGRVAVFHCGLLVFWILFFPFEIPFDTFEMDKRNWFVCCVVFSFHRWRYCRLLPFGRHLRNVLLCLGAPHVLSHRHRRCRSFPVSLDYKVCLSRIICYILTHLHFNQRKKIEANERTNGNETKKVEFHLN